jgi:hypothetical protein
MSPPARRVGARKAGTPTSTSSQSPRLATKPSPDEQRTKPLSTKLKSPTQSSSTKVGGRGSGKTDRPTSSRSSKPRSTSPKPPSPSVPPSSSGAARAGRGVQVGDEIELKRGLFGVAMYLGTVDFAPGLWLGVRIHEPKGKHDGTVGGRHYFTCRPKHGLFVRPDTLRWHRSTCTPTPLEMPDEMPEAHTGSPGGSNGTPQRPEVGGRTSPRPTRTDGAREAREARETKGTREGLKDRKKEERAKERSKEGARERTWEGTKDAQSPDDGRRGVSPRPRGASTGSPGSPGSPSPPRTKVKAGTAPQSSNSRFKAAARLVVAANKTRALAWASTPAEKSSSSGSSGGSGGGGGSSSSSSSSDSSAKRSVPPPKPPKKKTGSPTSPLGESFRSSSAKVQQSTRLFGKLKKQTCKTAVR